AGVGAAVALVVVAVLVAAVLVAAAVVLDSTVVLMSAAAAVHRLLRRGGGLAAVLAKATAKPEHAHREHQGGQNSVPRHSVHSLKWGDSSRTGSNAAAIAPVVIARGWISRGSASRRIRGQAPRRPWE